MKKTLAYLFLLTTLSLNIGGCAFAEAQFASSPAGIEAMNMGETCLNMKKKGLLSGIEASEDTPFKLKTEGILYSKRNNVTYPFQLNCIIIMNDQEHSFPFAKQSSNSEWKLSQ